MQKYLVTFQDLFSFSTVKREVPLSDAQYGTALRQMANNEIVVNRFDPKQAIHWLLVIKSITPSNENIPLL
jgi:hypothetical protein